MGKFKATMGKGFHFTFSNGYTISTQIGYGNYCQNRSNFEVSDMMSKSSYGIMIESEDCEIAIWDESGKWVTGEILDKFNAEINNDGQVAGYIEFNTWFEIMKFVEKL